MNRATCILLPGLLAASLVAVEPAVGQDARFDARLDVNRVLLTARVLDRHNHPILGLGPRDFRVEVDGEAATVESVEWVPGSAAYPGGLPPTEAAAAGVPPALPGRLVVFFFQNDFGFSRARLVGLMRMAPRARRFLDTLSERDLVAILSFDSHLKLQVDFTADRTTLADAIEPRALLREPGRLEPGVHPSLATWFDHEAALRAATPERALLVTARALRELPGAKTLVLFGWGLGHFSASGVRMDRDYEPARRELLAAGVTVFSMDVTDADFHSLEVGLVQVAEDTGGFYAKTHLFPDLAMARLDEAMQGHYELVFERPEPRRGPGVLEVTLVGLRGKVLTRSALD